MGGRNAGPVVPRRLQQVFAHRLINMGGAQPPGEQAAIEVGKGVQLGLERALARLLGRIERVEHIAEHPARVAAIGLGIILGFSLRPVWVGSVRTVESIGALRFERE